MNKLKASQLDSLRTEVDSIDNSIVLLLNKRVNIVYSMMKIKRKLKIPIRDIKREKMIVNRLSHKAKNIPVKVISDIWKIIFEYSYSIGRKKLR